MKVKELIEQLQELPQDDEIVITAMDDRFYLPILKITDGNMMGSIGKSYLNPTERRNNVYI